LLGGPSVVRGVAATGRQAGPSGRQWAAAAACCVQGCAAEREWTAPRRSTWGWQHAWRSLSSGPSSRRACAAWRCRGGEGAVQGRCTEGHTRERKCSPGHTRERKCSPGPARGCAGGQHGLPSGPGEHLVRCQRAVKDLGQRRRRLGRARRPGRAAAAPPRLARSAAALALGLGLDRLRCLRLSIARGLPCLLAVHRLGILVEPSFLVRLLAACMQRKQTRKQTNKQRKNK
jgi:hypothetical protein